MRMIILSRVTKHPNQGDQMGTKMKRVEVKWEDSHRVAGDVWESREGVEPLEPVLVMSVGYLVEETASHLTLTQSYTEDQFACRFCIPTGCIKGRRVL
jgi:hypothetical protein